VNSLVGSREVSAGTSRAESVISSSNVSDSEASTQPPIPSARNFSSVIVSLVDIAPPVREQKTEREVVTYSKEVQTTIAWSPPKEEALEGDDEDQALRKRVEEEVRRELEELRMDEDKAAREEKMHQLEVEKQLPGTKFPNCRFSREVWFLIIVISEEEQSRILTSDSFYDFLSRSSKIVERALDEDYDVLVDYTMDVAATQYICDGVCL
jgi:dynein intermediate chain, cytosolic